MKLKKTNKKTKQHSNVKLKRHSIRRQFALIFIGLMTGTILLCWFINDVFLERYYVNNKVKVLYNAYQTVAEATNSETYGTDEFAEELNKICIVSNLAVCIMDSNSQTKYISERGGRELELQLVGLMFEMQAPNRVLDRGEDYVIQQTSFGNTEYLLMFGQLSTGVSVILRTPVESIRESVEVSNRFLAYVGIVATVLGAVVMWLVAQKITKPIQKLNEISEQMVHLNFDAKYSGKARNEIGELGENMNKLSESLEQSISELKTANNELQKDIEKKEQIDEMRKEFLANVSHELKTPIALIQGYAEGLNESITDDPEERAYYCEVIMDEAAKMNTMVKQLLTLNQLEFGNDVITMSRFNITELVRNYLQSASILLKQNEITVYMEDFPDYYVWGDSFKIEEVVMNYFSNAINHCTGKKEIVIKIESVETKVRVSVFNTGDAIPEESLPHLWEKFYKVDKARTREYGGSGVGLSIVKAIMDAHGQGYGAANYANGVLFWFELEKIDT